MSNIHRRLDTGEMSSSSSDLSVFNGHERLERRHHNNDDPTQYLPGLPVVAFRLSDKYKKENPHVKQEWIQSMLRAKGWIVPNYGVRCVSSPFCFCVALNK
jgi:glutamate decarboxylase